MTAIVEAICNSCVPTMKMLRGEFWSVNCSWLIPTAAMMENMTHLQAAVSHMEGLITLYFLIIRSDSSDVVGQNNMALYSTF